MTDSVDLVTRWHSGEQEAFDALVERHLPWIRAVVHRRLGGLLRRKGQTVDFVQDALIKALRYSPRFTLSDDEQFRRLLARIVENHLRDEHDYLTAKVRDYQREVRPATHVLVDLDDPRRSAVGTPSREVMAAERDAMLHLALELLRPSDRTVIRMREWQELSFARIGEMLGIQENTARKRYDRAIVRLQRFYKQLESGQATAALDRSLGTDLQHAVLRLLRKQGDDLAEELASSTDRSTAERLHASLRALELVDDAVRNVELVADPAVYLQEVRAAIDSVRPEVSGEAAIAAIEQLVAAIGELRPDE